MYKDEDPPPQEKWVMTMKKWRGRKRRIVQRFKAPLSAASHQSEEQLEVGWIPLPRRA